MNEHVEERTSMLTAKAHASHKDGKPLFRDFALFTLNLRRLLFSLVYCLHAVVSHGRNGTIRSLRNWKDHPFSSPTFTIDQSCLFDRDKQCWYYSNPHTVSLRLFRNLVLAVDDFEGNNAGYHRSFVMLLPPSGCQV